MARETRTINLTSLKTLQALEKTIRRAAQEAEQVYCEDTDAADTVIEVHAALEDLLAKIAGAKRETMNGTPVDATRSLTKRDAVLEARNAGKKAIITFAGEICVVTKTQANAMEEAGERFAYLTLLEINGREQVVTIPAN